MSDAKRIEHLFKHSLPFFNALGDPVRQKLMIMMMNGEHLSVKQLTAGTQLSRPTISHHLKVLKNAHLIIERKVGREIYYQPQPGDYFYTVKDLMDTIDKAIKEHTGDAK